MWRFRLVIGAALVLLLTAMSACQPIQPVTAPVDAVESERISVNLVALTKLVTDDTDLQGYRFAINGYGTWDPQNPEDVVAGGSYAMFDSAAEGLPKPLIELGEGTWRAIRGIEYVAYGGSYGEITPGVLDMEVELVPNEGEPVTAQLRIICNVGFAGMVNMEDGTSLPEGFFITVPELGTFEPIISAEPSVPPFGLTSMNEHIPAIETAGGGERLGFDLVALTKLDTEESETQGYRLAFSGYGTWDPQNPEDVVAGGSFAMFDSAVEGLPKPLVGVGDGNWRAIRGINYTAYGESYGGITPGVLDIEAELVPNEGDPVVVQLRVICNVGFAGMINMEDGAPLPEGYFMTVPEIGTFVPIVSTEPGVPPFGLTHMGPHIP